MSELKEMLRLGSDPSQDTTLTSLNVAARTWCEALTQRKFVQQTWRLGMDFFPGYIDLKLAGQKVSSPFVSGSNAVLVGIRYAIALPFPPVQSLVAFNYQDANGGVTALTSPAGYTADLLSQPARLTPPFGTMWPVAKVVVNAVQVDFQVGYATPKTCSIASGQKSVTVATFTTANVGQPLCIPGAGSAGSDLNTIIMSVDGSGLATVRDSASASVANVTGLLVDHGTAGHWDLIKLAIKFLVNNWYIYRVPRFDPSLRDAVRAILSPVRDVRF
jgi:hypothetical protein